VKRELAAAGVDEAELKKLDGEIKRIVAEAADFAEQSPEPNPSELYTDVLVETY
jgi:pyruvate dehydrogenase E1 component alpha subunit